MEAGCVVAAVIENAASGPQHQPGSCDVLEGDVLPPADPDKEDKDGKDGKDDKDDKDADGDPPAEKPETCSLMVRSDDITELPAEPLLRSCVSTASMKVKNMKKLTFPRGHFPRLAECAHFHYETVDFGNVQLAFAEGQPGEGPKAGLDSKELVFLVQISCQARSWLVKRSYEDFRVLDKHLHLCIYDRRYSQLAELPRCDALRDAVESGTTMLATYLSRLSAIADNKINCGPVLTWMEVDNKGNHLLVSEEASINVPAIAAAHVTKRYTAQATDELTFEVGDIVSVIDMPPKEDTGWWRGKHGFQVGFFPCDCVELINDKIPPSVQSSVPKPVCKKHGKLVTFLRTFMKSRPPPQKLRQRGILRERVFGCDLGEYLHNSGHEVPQVVKSCADFIEKNGVTDGIYRLSGISSNIQKLRHEFDSEQVPDLSRDVFTQDIHSVGSLCKLYFRELPNPLLTYQLYDRFSEAVSAATDEERLVKIHNVIQQLPPPHYRTLEYLMRHLSHLATFSPVTNMHTKNLAIVWAPNLLRSRQIESACFSGTAAFMEVRIQSVVVEFILNNTEALFSTKLSAIIRESTGNNTMSRPKSLLVCSPSTKLLTLEEAQARTQAQLGSPATTPCLSHSDYIEVGEGPGALLGKFHTVIELPMESGKRPPVKAKKSPVGNWLSFFHLGKSSSVSKRKLKRHPSEPNEIKSIALPGGRGDGGTLRSTKSEESLTSLLNVKGEPSTYRPRRPRSTSEALSDHRAPPLDGSHNNSGGDRVRTAACISPPHQEDDLDLCPPAAGIYSLDFDPMSFQCSPLSATPGPPRHKDGSKWRKSEWEPVNNNGGGGYRSPDVSPVLGRESKKVASKPLSPKLRKKSFKMQADVPPPPPSSSRLLEKCNAPPADGKEARAAFPHCSPVSVASISDMSQPAANLPDPGADRLMSSVSVLPPHPPLTSAARKLALALAESAQKASSGGGSQRRHDHQVAGAPDRPPPRPSVLDLKAYPQEHRGGAPWQTVARSPAGGGTHPGNFLPAHLVSEESNFTPNVSPLGSGSLDEGSAEARREGRGEPTYQSVGVSTPTQPAAAQTPSPSPVYVNTDSVNVFNFRAVLAETSMPASIDEVIPRPLHHYGNEEDRPLGDDVYSNHHHHRPIQAGRTPAPRPDAIPPHILGPKNLYRQSSEGHYSTLGLRPPSSPQCRRYRRDEHLGGGGCHGQPAPWQQRTEDRVMCHPAIRRARSFHAPQISHYELAKAEAPPPPDAMFYMAQTACQEVPYQRLIQTGVHPVRQQFESADYRYDLPDACVNARYYVEPCRQQSAAVRHSQSYSMRSRRGGGPADYYDYSPRHAAPVNRELYIESRDTVVYQARDAEVFVYQPLTQEVKSKRRNVRPAALPYESPVSPGDARNRDIMHTRSKSDPGNACLVSAGRTENSATSPNACRSRQVDLEVARQPFGHPAGPSRRIQIKETSSSQQAPLRKIPSLPEHNNNRGHDPERFMTNSYTGAVKPSILRRSGRSQSTRENRHYYHYHAKSPLDPEQPGSFSTQPNRRTQSTKVRPTQYDHKEGYYAAPRLKPSRSGKAGAGYLPGVSPRGHRLLCNALRQEAFYHGAMRSEAGVYD